MTHKKIGVILLAFTLLLGTFIQPINSQAKESQDTEPNNDGGTYLSDLDWQDATNDPVKDKAADDSTLSLTNNEGNSVDFDKGIGTKVNTEINYDVSELDYQYLTTWVGLQADSNKDESLQFEIYVDDDLKYASKDMNGDTPMEYETLDFSGAETLTLVTNGSEDADSIYGNWGEIRLHQEDPITRNGEDIKQYEGMELIFNEEFEGDSLDEENWQFSETPENGNMRYANTFGKGENVWLEDGNLILRANEYEGDEPEKFNTTSGSIMSEDKFDFQYGRIDVRAKIPTETGMWPAIWMMPADQQYDWPMEGEIDIMELISQEPNKIYSTIHSGIDGVDNDKYYFKSGGTTTIDQGTYYDDYYVYSMDWQPGVMKFYVDDVLVKEVTDWENYILDEETDEVVPRDFPTPFDQSYFIKLNLATGGGWADDVDETTRFGDRTSMNIDYVRVYQDENPEYQYSKDEPYLNGNQGAVWYAQKDLQGTWENYKNFNGDSGEWTSEDSNDFVSTDRISADFGSDSAYQSSAVGFRAPYDGHVKVSLNEDVSLEQSSEVEYNISKGDMTSTQMDELNSKTIINDTENLSQTKTYVNVDVDDMIRFEVLNSENVVENFDPVVEYVDQSEYDAYVTLEEKVKELEQTDTSSFTEASVKEFEAALQSAQNLLNGSGDESAYANANEALVFSYDELEETPDPVVDKKPAEDKVNEAKNLDTSGMTSESVKALKNTIEQAELALNDPNASQNDIDKATNNLTEAMDALEIEEKEDPPATGETEQNDQNGQKGQDDNKDIGANKNDEEDGDKLPKTSTFTYNSLLIGFILLLAGTGVFFIARRKKSRSK